ncbi:MAG: hypothetical protein EOP38_01990 [Rubrivivax sp.]|nr:MAG: hypothetical protein EOP38_01990 [Rubrivivax sp.]
MKNQGWVAAATLGAALLSQQVHAELLTFNGTDNGKTVAGTISADFSSAPLLTETLLDGRQHKQFSMDPQEFGIEGRFSVVIDGDTANWWGGYFEGYEHGGGMQGIGPQVNSYLTPDGRSSLVLDWAIDSACHGGCSSWQSIHVELFSENASLFANRVDDALFHRYDSGHGFALSDSRYSDGTSYHHETNFQLSAVPEASTALLAMIGGAAMLCMAPARRRRTQQTA